MDAHRVAESSVALEIAGGTARGSRPNALRAFWMALAFFAGGVARISAAIFARERARALVVVRTPNNVPGGGRRRDSTVWHGGIFDS